MDASAIELKSASSGKELLKLWFPAGEFFSFFSLFFDARKDASPDVYGSWTIAQEETRRYVFPLTEFHALASDIIYVCSNPGTSAEMELENSYESRSLRTIETWTGPLRVEVSSTATECIINFLNHPGASGRFTSSRLLLMKAFMESCLQRWFRVVPAIRLGEIWFVPLGGSYSVSDGNGNEFAIIDSEDIFAIQAQIANYAGGEISEQISPSVRFGIHDTGSTLTVLEQELPLTFREVEVLMSFFTTRLFLSESGTFSRWRDDLITNYHKKQ